MFAYMTRISDGKQYKSVTISFLSKQWIKVLDQIICSFSQVVCYLAHEKAILQYAAQSWMLRAADKACTPFQVLLCCLIMEMEAF